jgi:glutaredoxin
MDQHRIQYNFTDVDLLTGDARTIIMDEVRKYNPKCTFPTILVGEKVIIGFNESALRGVLELE